jgi:hypothetical protein
MEIVSGFLLWLTDVFGLRWIRKESSIVWKVVRAITFLLIGVFSVVIYLVIFS